MTQVFPLPFKLLWSPDISPTDGYFENNVELSFLISKGLQNDGKCQENERYFPDSVNVFFNLMQLRYVLNDLFFFCHSMMSPREAVSTFQWSSSQKLALFSPSVLHVCLLSLAKTQELICRVFANFARPPKKPLSPLYGCMAREGTGTKISPPPSPLLFQTSITVQIYIFYTYYYIVGNALQIKTTLVRIFRKLGQMSCFLPP